MIAVIDYDAGNIKSVVNALEYIGEKPVVTRDAKTILSADKVILPGVGAFEDAMNKLNSMNLVDVIKKVADKGTPFLGICLGMQLIFEGSEESENDVEGLSLIPGRIIRFPKTEGFKIPHMGWNSIEINPSSRLFKGLDNQSYVYFVHSYYLQAGDIADVSATTDYIVDVHAAVEKGNIFGTQFHPEKSGDVGMQILKNFINL